MIYHIDYVIEIFNKTNFTINIILDLNSIFGLFYNNFAQKFLMFLSYNRACIY